MLVIMVITAITFVVLNNSQTVTNERNKYLSNMENKVLNPETPPVSNNAQEKFTLLSKFKMMPCSHSVLLVLETFILMILYSVLASIEPYSSLPYGNVAYLLAVHISRIVKPVAYFLMFFIPTKKLATTFYLTGIIIWGVTFQAVIASLSPAPPLQSTKFGGTLVVSTYYFL